MKLKTFFSLNVKKTLHVRSEIKGVQEMRVNRFNDK